MFNARSFSFLRVYPVLESSPTIFDDSLSPSHFLWPPPRRQDQSHKAWQWSCRSMMCCRSPSWPASGWKWNGAERETELAGANAAHVQVSTLCQGPGHMDVVGTDIPSGTRRVATLYTAPLNVKILKLSSLNTTSSMSSGAHPEYFRLRVILDLVEAMGPGLEL
ncbi:hypothetical protein BDW71DRAFT_188381 [Aspergillus fruticulosus]